MQGEVTSSTGLGATIPGADASRAGLMSSADKTKLDKIPAITTADQNKVLTVNATGDAAEWKDAAPASGGGGPRYYKLDGGKVFVKAIGSGNITYTRNKNFINIIVPNGVFLDYMRINMNLNADMPGESALLIAIKDESGLTNNDHTDMVVPTFSIGNRTATNISLGEEAIWTMGQQNGPNQSVVNYGGGEIMVGIGGINNFNGTNGFYVNINY
jgi:hypothetical protein